MKIIELFERYIAHHYLLKMSRVFLEKYPQIICFSFDDIAHEINFKGRYENEELLNLNRFVFPNLKRKRICLDI